MSANNANFAMQCNAYGGAVWQAMPFKRRDKSALRSTEHQRALVLSAYTLRWQGHKASPCSWQPRRPLLRCPPGSLRDPALVQTRKRTQKLLQRPEPWQRSAPVPAQAGMRYICMHMHGSQSSTLTGAECRALRAAPVCGFQSSTHQGLHHISTH